MSWTSTIIPQMVERAWRREFLKRRFDTTLGKLGFKK